MKVDFKNFDQNLKNNPLGVFNKVLEMGIEQYEERKFDAAADLFIFSIKMFNNMYDIDDDQKARALEYLVKTSEQLGDIDILLKVNLVLYDELYSDMEDDDPEKVAVLKKIIKLVLKLNDSEHLADALDIIAAEYSDELPDDPDFTKDAYYELAILFDDFHFEDIAFAYIIHYLKRCTDETELDVEKRYKAYSIMAFGFSEENMLDNAIIYYQKILALDIEDKPNLLYSKAGVYTQIVDAFVNLNQHEQALHYAEESILFIEKYRPDFDEGLIALYELVLKYYDEMKDKKKEFEISKKIYHILKISPHLNPNLLKKVKNKIKESEMDFDNLPDNIEACLALLVKIEGSEYYGKLELALVYSHIANLYKAAGNSEKAIEYYKKTQNICKKSKDNSDAIMADVLFSWGILCFSIRKIDDCIKYLEASLPLSKRFFDKNGVKNFDLYHTLAVCYAEKRRFEPALEQFQKALLLTPQSEDISNEKIQIVISHYKNTLSAVGKALSPSKVAVFEKWLAQKGFE